MDEQYEDPRYSSSQGRWVSYNSDQGPVWEALTMAAPLGEYGGSGDDGGNFWRGYSPEETAAAAAKIEADRLARLEMASGILADNPLSVTGDRIQTRFGDVDVSRFKPIAADGQPITGETAAQLVDPNSGTPIFLSNPNDPFSYTYDVTDTPAISGTVAQQAALYRPVKNQGVFGSLGGDLLSAVKDPYFRNFALAAGAMAGAAALAPSLGTAGAGSTGITGSTAGGFLGGPGEILAGATGTGGGSLGAASGSLTGGGGFLGGAGEILPGAVGTGGGSLGASGLSLGPLGEITAKQALTAARLGLPVLSAVTKGAAGAGSGLGSLALPAGALAAALAARGNQSFQPGVTAPIPELTLDWGYQYTPSERPGVTMGQQYLNPRFFQEGGLSSLDDMQRQESGQSFMPTNVMDEVRQIVNDEKPINSADEYLSLLNRTLRQPAVMPRFNPQPAGLDSMMDYERRFAMGGDVGSRYASPNYGGYGNTVSVDQTANMAPLSPMQGNYQGYAKGGLSDLGAYSDGGRMLKGPGDGMSDSIPANIEGKRPARLATDEFVVPADVVSHLGNGSSDAGAKVLYAMMNRVRKARTGQKKQGRQINPNKFMPV